MASLEYQRNGCLGNSVSTTSRPRRGRYPRVFGCGAGALQARPAQRADLSAGHGSGARALPVLMLSRLPQRYARHEPPLLPSRPRSQGAQSLPSRKQGRYPSTAASWAAAAPAATGGCGYSTYDRLPAPAQLRTRTPPAARDRHPGSPSQLPPPPLPGASRQACNIRENPASSAPGSTPNSTSLLP